MLDKLKQFGNLKALQDEAKKERFEATNNGVKVVINGTLQVEEVTLNSELDSEQLAQAVKQSVNDALKSAQMSMAQKMQGMM